MDSSSPLFTQLPLLLCLAVVVTGGLIAALCLHRQRAAAALAMQRAAAPAPGKIIYSDAPTVRVADSQRVDRRRKIVRLSAGEHVDILETPDGMEPRFRITLKSVVRMADAAHIAVAFGGTRVSCGPLVQEQSTNEFIVPRALGEESRSSVFHYFEKGSSLDFMRIKVRALDATAGTAELDVMQIAAHWPPAE
ncbi:MAG TPA: hypothetical protein VJT10_11555 [Steroidobacteraceae bacterium]|jgi:hypothetical protein|nr:hypothetical protein [Steroidobacteraceae bacterium]